MPSRATKWYNMRHKRMINELVTNCDQFKSMKHSSVTMTAFSSIDKSNIPDILAKL